MPTVPYLNILSTDEFKTITKDHSFYYLDLLPFVLSSVA
ncbi:hypothetical protein MALU111345_21120 [Marinicrinis lubricantis]